MRSPAEITAELDTLGCPKPCWGSIGSVVASMEATRKWRSDNPEKARAYESLVCEFHEAEQAAREIAALERVMERAASAGVGERTREAAKSPADTPAILAARAWLKARQTWLLLAGDVGTGKSVAAVWALLEVAKEGHSVAFRRTAEVARLSGFDAGADELKRLKTVGLLVLDDMGTECATGWGVSILHELLDTRHDEKRRTILTSNLKRKDARTRLGDRMSDRIQQDGRVVWLEGKSLRATPS